MFLKDVKKFVPLFLTTLIVVVILFVLSHYGISIGILLSIGAVLLAPIISITVGEYLRVRTERQREEYEVLRTLVSFRHTPGSSEFLGALNSVILVFNNNTEIKSLVKNLWNGYVNSENPAVSKRRQIELVYAICKHMGKNVTEFEIDSFFVPAPRNIPSKVENFPNLPTNPSSTASNTNNNFPNKINSCTINSITAGSFLNF